MKVGAIVVAVDGSPASEAALQQATDRAREQGLPLTGIFILNTGWADRICKAREHSADAAQGFIHYATSELELQLDAARAQFAQATHDFAGDASFEVVPGDPVDTLCELMAQRDYGMLVAGREAFQLWGSPSVNQLMHDLQQCVRQPLVIV